MLPDLIAEIQNKNAPVSILLLKAKVIATKRKDTDFLKWIEIEIDGYKGRAKPPEYRGLHGQAKFWNPMLGWCPIVFHSTQLEEQLINRTTNQSISELEQILESGSDEFEMPYPADVAAHIMQGEMSTKVSMFISRSSIVSIVNRVRNIILNWALSLEEGTSQENTVSFDEDEQIEKLKFNLSFSSKQGELTLVATNGKENKVKVQGQVQKEVLRTIFQNSDDAFSTWSLYDISEILGVSDVDETAVKNALYQFNKKVQLAIPQIKELFVVTKNTAKLNQKYANKN